MKYEVLPHEGHAHIHGGKVLEAGEIVELDEEVAQIHVDVLRPVDSPQPEMTKSTLKKRKEVTNEDGHQLSE